MNRYAHHLRLEEFQNNGQEKLNKAKVLVVGAGGLGCPIIIYLAGAGIGTLGIIDQDTVDLSNLHRQILFGEKDVGKPKALIAAQKAKEINSEIQIDIYTERLTFKNGEQIAKHYDIIVDACDNYTTTYLLNDICVLQNKPLIFAAIQRFSALQANFLPQKGCYRCIFPNFPTIATGSCNEIGVVGPLPGIVGSMQALEVIKVLLSKETKPQLLQYDFLTQTQKSLRFSQDDDCKVCGKTPSINQISEDHYTHQIPPHRKLTLTEANNKELQWIDIRSKIEYDQGHFAHAKNIPLDQFDVTLLLEKPSIIYCASGQRCELLWPQLRHLQHIFFLNGGFQNDRQKQPFGA